MLRNLVDQLSMLATRECRRSLADEEYNRH